MESVGRSIIHKTDKNTVALVETRDGAECWGGSPQQLFLHPGMAPEHSLKIKDCIAQYYHKQLRIKYVLCSCTGATDEQMVNSHPLVIRATPWHGSEEIIFVQCVCTLGFCAFV